MKVEKPRVALTLDNKAEITFICDRAILDTLEAITTDFIDLSLKEYHPKRTLDQNSLLWEILGKMSNKLNEPSTKLYKQYIRDYGKFEIVVMKDEAIDTFISTWSKNGLGNFAEIIRKSNFDGYSILKVFYGSSTYSTLEMIHLIEPILLDCEELGIPTLTMDNFKKLRNDVDKKQEIS